MLSRPLRGEPDWQSYPAPPSGLDQQTCTARDIFELAKMRLLHTPSRVRGQSQETRLALLKDSNRRVAAAAARIARPQGDHALRGSRREHLPQPRRNAARRCSLTCDSAWFGRPAINRTRVAHWRFPARRPIWPAGRACEVAAARATCWEICSRICERARPTPHSP
jgi:hypothetical protein